MNQINSILSSSHIKKLTVVITRIKNLRDHLPHTELSCTSFALHEHMDSRPTKQGIDVTEPVAAGPLQLFVRQWVYNQDLAKNRWAGALDGESALDDGEVF